MLERYRIRWTNSRGKRHYGPALYVNPDNSYTGKITGITEDEIQELQAKLSRIERSPVPMTLEQAQAVADRANETAEFHNVTHKAVKCR